MAYSGRVCESSNSWGLSQHDKIRVAKRGPFWRLMCIHRHFLFKGGGVTFFSSPPPPPRSVTQHCSPTGKSTYREDYHIPNKVDVSFNGAGNPASSAAYTGRPHTATTSRPDVSQLRERERAKREAQSQKKQDRLLLAKSRVAHQLK